MKEIIVDGVSYLPASTLAKDFKYTSDYIGQLCRAKKVDAQLVGRSWYVNPLSLQTLRTKRYSRKETNKKSQTREEDDTFSIPVRVDSPLAKTTVKQQELRTPQNYIKRIDWKPLKYEDDSSELLPALGKSSRPVSLQINLAESSDITIKSSSKSTSLIPEDLPVVSLKGKIKIVSLEEGFDVDVDSVEDETFSLENVLPVPEVSEERGVSKRDSVSRSHEVSVLADYQPQQAKSASVDYEVDEVSWTLGESLLLVTNFALLGVVLLITFLTIQVEVSEGFYLREFLLNGDGFFDLFSRYFL